ncbi:hypothetical protein B0A53_03922 [Rhodotorula sp. CCFEE 5036]|nr:hypothetical protein B0A53_03922 [Rhodotorula sp. CCFEE 5036]
MFHPTRGGTRGGQGDFKWSDVAADKDREYYLGHSLRAPVGRWQNGKDLTWYNKEGGADAEARERERQEELKRIKEAEEDALAQALGFAPTPRQPTVPATPSVSTSTSTDPNAAILEKARRKAEKRAEHEARKAERQRVREERAARHKHSRDEREGSPGPGRHGDEPITTAATSGTTTADPQGHATTIAILSYDRATIAQMHPGSSGEFAAAAPTGGSIRSPLLIVVVALVLLPSFATAFFEQFFHQQHAQQQQAQRPPTWDEQLETVSCSTFICPDFTCVASPADCPCPSRMDEKCVIPDATGSGADAYVCARDCAKVTAAMHAFH